jgi:hypoxanthine phosphoribosyltransferase
MSSPLIPGVERILFTEEQIDARIREVAAEINRDYAGRTLKLAGVLKGSIFFLTALARYIDVPLKIDFLAISSFSDRSGSPGVVRIAKDLDEGIEGEDVLLVEDIVDTGFTLRYLLQTLAGRAPNSLSVCTFLDRNSRRIVQVPVDYRCFEIPDRFVVGFGLDHNQLSATRYVAVMKQDKPARRNRCRKVSVAESQFVWLNHAISVPILFCHCHVTLADLQ